MDEIKDERENIKRSGNYWESIRKWMKIRKKPGKYWKSIRCG